MLEGSGKFRRHIKMKPPDDLSRWHVAEYVRLSEINQCPANCWCWQAQRPDRNLGSGYCLLFTVIGGVLTCYAFLHTREFPR